MTHSIHSFLLSVVIIHSSPMILNHGPVVISFDLQKCRRTNNCEALYSSNNENPTQLAVANIAFNAKSNKSGKIKLNTTESKASNKEIYINQTIAINTRENSGNRFNLGSGASDDDHNVIDNSETIQNILFNDTREFSNENVNNFNKENSNLTYVERQNLYMKFKGGKDTLIDDKSETVKSNSSKWSLQDNNDDAENRKSSLNIENQTDSHSKVYSNVIDSNQHAINKLKPTKSFQDESKIETGNKTNGLNKIKMLLNYFKCSTYCNNNISNIQSKATVDKHVVDTDENETIVSLTNKCNDKINNSKQSINQQVIKFNDSSSKFDGNVKNNQTLEVININGDKNKDRKSNYNMKQSNESKIAYYNKTTWNHICELINKRNKTNDAHDRTSKENGFFNISNDDGDFKNQTDALEFNIDINESTTEFSADKYYENVYNKMDEIRKSAINSFIELDKETRPKRTQQLEALLSRMTPAKPETSEEKDGNPLHPLPKFIFNEIYSNMFKPTMLFRNKKDKWLSNLNLANFDLQTQSTSISSSSMTATTSQYEGTTLLLHDKYTSESTSTLKPQKLERGLLDLIFPPSRVTSFKNLFNAIRRILSGTF